MELDFSLVKRHPVAIGGAVAGGLLLIFVVTRGGGGTSVQAAGVDPAQAALAMQQAHDQTSLDAQHGQLQYGLELATINTNAATAQTNTAATVAMAQISADRATASESVAATVQTAQLAQATQLAGIGASLQGLLSNNLTTEHIALITANEQLGLANIVGNTQIALSNNVTNASIAATNAQASVAKSSSSNSMIGSIASALLGGLFG